MYGLYEYVLVKKEIEEARNGERRAQQMLVDGVMPERRAWYSDVKVRMRLREYVIRVPTLQVTGRRGRR